MRYKNRSGQQLRVCFQVKLVCSYRVADSNSTDVVLYPMHGRVQGITIT
jgi:hypothetical protein